MNVKCILCGESGRVRVDVETADIHCNDCDGAYDAALVRETIAGWEKVLPWIESHPALTAAPEGVSDAQA